MRGLASSWVAEQEGLDLLNAEEPFGEPGTTIILTLSHSERTEQDRRTPQVPAGAIT